MTDTDQPIDTMPFEQALKELETIVSALEAGDVPLEKSIALYERGVKLKQHCQKKLETAQMKIEKISLDSAGNPQAAPLDD